MARPSSNPSSSDASTGDDEKRARILDAALQVCARRGVVAARMEEVATLAGVSKGTLYRHFESKEDLLLATILASYGGPAVVVDGTGADESEPGARLDRIFDTLTKVFTAVSPRMKVHYQAWGLVASAPSFERRLFDFLQRFHAEEDALVRDTIRAGQQSGVFAADVDVEAFVDAVAGLLSGALYRATFDPDRVTPERLRASFDALVGRALVGDGKERVDG